MGVMRNVRRGGEKCTQYWRCLKKRGNFEHLGVNRGILKLKKKKKFGVSTALNLTKGEEQLLAHVNIIMSLGK
jgi:hypothetical protein